MCVQLLCLTQYCMYHVTLLANYQRPSMVIVSLLPWLIFFSKWSEAEALPDTSAKSVSLFMYKMMSRCNKIISLLITGNVIEQSFTTLNVYRCGCTKVVIST